MNRILSLLLFAFASQLSLQSQSSITKKISDEFDVKMLNDLAVTPSGDEIVFTAVGKVYSMNGKDKKPTQLTKGQSEFEFEPSYSSDGKQIVFASWNESGYGKIHIYDKRTKWKKTALITSGIYRDPKFSNDGNFITYKKEIEIAKVDTANQKTEGLYVLNLKEGDPVKVSSYGENPQFTPDGNRLLYQSGTYRFGSFVKTFESVDLAGNDKQILFYGKYGHEYAISPDMKRVAWQELGKIYMTSFPLNPVGLTASNQGVDLQQLSDLPGNNLSWSKDSNKLSWTIANKLYSVEIDDDSEVKSKDIELKHKADVPEGVLAFTNARIITMKGDEVIEHGTIIVKGNQIIDVGFDIQVPKEAHAINCSGKTIMPGLVDLTPKSNNYDYNLSPIQQWEYIELLKTGITTKLDGGFKIANGFTNRELVSAGRIIGPRVLSGGVTIAAMDTTLFSEESYMHYQKSNLLIAKAFDVAGVQSDLELDVDDILVLDNVQSDTTIVKSNDILKMIIEESNNGADKLKLLQKYTSQNSKLIGLSQQIGTIQKGKLADLIIIDGNPVESIEELSKVTHTVINGRIYQCTTMEEVGNYRKRITRTANSAIYESLNRAMGSACCGFQH